MRIVPNSVLIIDDEPDFAAFVADVIEGEGYTPLVATSAKQAITQLDDETIACVISDIVMPDMDGIELVQKLAETRCTVPIILMSGHGKLYLDIARTIGEQKAVNIVGILTKPFTVNELVAKISAMISK
jgi:DNA-binding response OmpR family regulator